MAVRAFALLARKARKAVIFRRGPSKRVLLIAWDTDRDTFTPGQWLKGTIYERRCDLSPSGEKLIYFAANWKKPFQSWTAISKPPWLTALALWPKGDAWGGGGIFADETHVQLNHWIAREDDVRPKVGGLPPRLHVAALGERWGRGEDFPVWGLRLQRDGWTHAQIGTSRQKPYETTDVWYPYDPPHIWTRPSPKHPSIELRMIVRGLKKEQGPWYVVEHEVVHRANGASWPMGESDWADWDATGDLLFARNGRIYRAKSTKHIDAMEARELIDLRGMKFEEIVAPKEARRW